MPTRRDVEREGFARPPLVRPARVCCTVGYPRPRMHGVRLGRRKSSLLFRPRGKAQVRASIELEQDQDQGQTHNNRPSG